MQLPRLIKLAAALPLLGSSTRGWRNDVVGALRQVGVPAQQPARSNIRWGGMENNRVGTHEFMDLVEQLDSEACLSGSARGRVLTGPAMDVHNSFQQPQAVVSAAYAAASAGLLKLPPQSIVVVEVAPRP